MDADWDEVSRLQFPPGARGLVTTLTSMTFDTTQELLWTGSIHGRVMSFFGRDLRPYTSFMVADGQVSQLLVNERGVIALGPRDLHMAIRRGPPLWHIRREEMKSLWCMSFTSKGTQEILVAGLQDQMFVVDCLKGEIVKQIPTKHHYRFMKRSRYICAATNSGDVHILDPVSFTILKVWNAHSAAISDLDVQDDFIVTCGYSLRAGQTWTLDRFLNVFDMKKMSSTSPIPFPPGAAYVRMHPRMSTTTIAVSQSGQMHVVDLANPNTSNIHQAKGPFFLNMLEIAPTGEALALGDVESNIYLWGSPSKLHFVPFQGHPEFETPEEPAPQIDLDTDAPLNTVGIPYYREILLSAWPTLVSDIGGPPLQLDPQHMATLTSAEFGLYGPNTGRLLPNQVVKSRQILAPSNPGIQAPKFLSEKARESAKASASSVAFGDETSVDQESFANSGFDNSKSDIPAKYRNVEIKYSRFGVDDFDFRYYNQTNYSGLEIHVPNSYANSLLQVMRFTPLVRNCALEHTATACIAENCLLCEMGFLFDMLEKAEGSICHASNMLKTLSGHPQAAALGLLEEDAHDRGSPLTVTLQTLNRFLLDRLVQDFRSMKPDSNAMNKVFVTEAQRSIRCMSCGSQEVGAGSTYVNDLLYPPAKAPVRNQKATRTTFSQVLKASVERETTSKGWCNVCQRYQSLASRRTIDGIPLVLMLNAAITSPEAKRLWSTPGWLPEEIGVITDRGQFYCFEGEELKLHLQRRNRDVTVYSLTGVIVNVERSPNQRSHLVAMVNVAHSQVTAPVESQWHLFNDFLIQPVSSGEALTFTVWKTPSVLAYQAKQENNKIDMSWKDALDVRLLFQTVPNRRNGLRVLDGETEQPGPGSIIAIDTEFVAVRQPEIEMNVDGVRETIRPTLYALARVSVVRGEGIDEGVPFIDDYITIREPVVDYLTSYSGISRDDLDPRTSKHNLVSLKTAYKKLWILLNRGCQFLGHGLKQDFRVINIHIPKPQVIDTIDLLFWKDRLRRLSLAFLAWYLLKEDIQLETHDSIEDSRTALKLYRKYQEFQDAGILEAMLQDIYNKGREVNFKPPRREGQRIKRTDTPPLPVEVRGPGSSTRG